MSPGVKNGVLAIIVVLILGAAAYFLFKGDPESGPPDTDESKTTWVCVKTGEVMELTAKDVSEWMKDPQKVKMFPETRSFAFWCDASGDFTMVRAQWCPESEKWIPKHDLNGQLQMCPEDLEAMNE